MVDVIAINISSAELARRAERLARARRFQRVDRVPVYPNMYMRYWLPQIGGSYAEYFADPEVMLRSQIFGQKWILENVQSDRVFDAIYVDFQNAMDASCLGCDTVFGEDGLIWVREGWVRTKADVRKLKEIDPLKTNLGARALAYAERMCALADRYVVRLSDGAEFRPAEHPQLSFGTMGVFTTAAQLVGLAELCEALYLEPSFARELLSVVTEKTIDLLQFCRRAQGMGAFWLADDYAGNLSAQQFREFVLPCLRRIHAHFSDRPFKFHMCGKVDHLVRVLADELCIDEFSMFGYQLDKQLVQTMMGGRVVLMGNINPMNLYTGTLETVMQESLEGLGIFGKGEGGFILSDGANIAPGTPLENINAMWRAACEFAAEASTV